MQHRNANLKFTSLPTVFREIHKNAIRGLLWPLKLALHNQMEPLIQAAAARNNEALRPTIAALTAIDATLFPTDPRARFCRKVKLKMAMQQSAGRTCCWYNFDGKWQQSSWSPPAMPVPIVDIEIDHEKTYGQNHVISVLGRWLPTDEILSLKKGDKALCEMDLNPEVQEAFDYTIQQCQIVYTELNSWYRQFSRRKEFWATKITDEGMNEIHGPENYHRIAAAMYYSPIFNQWVQHLRQHTIELAPVCDKLTRSNSFDYVEAMTPELHAALSTGLNLYKAELEALKKT